jgi:hypothetical protein
MIDTKQQKIVTLQKSQFIERFFHLNSQPISLDDYPHMRTIINIQPKNLVLKFGRQTTKSTTTAEIIAANSILLPKNPNSPGAGGFASMYVSPTVEQTKVFSHDRLTPFLEGSPWVKKHYMSSRLVQNVFTKQLLNGSKMYLRYALLTADRLRGWSVDMITYDEAQDILPDIIPVANQAMSRSYYKWNIFSGTPKTTRGTLANKWYQSSMNEWMPKCPGCNKYNFLDEKNIGLKGCICRYCGKTLKPEVGTWVRTQKQSIYDKFGHIEGFRVSQLQFANAPWVNWYDDIIIPYEQYGKGLFYNEVLGLEYDAGTSPITREELIRCCTGGQMFAEPDPVTRSYPCYMGIDYGPLNSISSYTVIAIVQSRGEFLPLHVVYLKRFTGKEADPAFIQKEILRLRAKFGCVLLGADYGLGEFTNAELRKKIGFERVIAYQHQGNQKDRIHWNKKMFAYTTSRTRVMTELFTKVKRRQIVFPHWDYFETFGKDFLAIGIEYDELKRKMKYVNNDPDDALHAVLYACLVAELADRIGVTDPSYAIPI